MKYKKVSHNGVDSITVYLDGELYSATDSHWNWDNILDAVEDETATPEMFDPVRIVNKYMQLSTRIAVRNDVVVYDEEPVDAAISDQIVRFIAEGLDPAPLVKFIDKCYANPSEHSRKQLYSWVKNANLSLTPDGDIIGFKYLMLVSEGDKDVLQSGHSGSAFVNGQEQNGYIKQKPGDVVTMPRGSVVDDPDTACSHGLHFGTWGYVHGYGDAVHYVVVDPRDVVSVPGDGAGEKVRCCRYTLGTSAWEFLDQAVCDSPVPETHEFDSSAVKSATYVPFYKTLDITLHSGNTYAYDDVSESTWNEFKSTSSAGRFYNTVIKNR